MDIILSNVGGQPIYDQIVSQIKAQILSGKLKEGDALPSLRTLARELRISVITTKRAYEELEREGFIVSYRQGQLCGGRGRGACARGTPAPPGGASAPGRGALAPVRSGSGGA